MINLCNWFFSRREVIAKSSYSLLSVNRKKKLVYKKIFNITMFRHEESITRFLQDKSSHVVPLLFSDPSRHLLVFPQADQDLFEWLYENQTVKKMEANHKNKLLQGYVLQIVHGLYDLYFNRIEHYDLKPQNILLFADGSAKLADFGCAVHEGTAYTMWTGSYAYMAPELTGSSHTTIYVPHSVDVYSFCIMIIYIFFPMLFIPRYEPMTQEEYRALKEHARNLLIYHNVAQDLSRDLLSGLEEDPRHRIMLPLLLNRMMRYLTDTDTVLS